MKAYSHYFSLPLLGLILALAGCQQLLDFSNGKTASIKDPSSASGKVEARMFLPDYAKLAGQGISGKAIPPQAAKVRLGIKQATGSFLAHQTLDLKTGGTWTPVSTAAASFPGSMWTGTFLGLPASYYRAGDLQMEILAADGSVLCSGLNSAAAAIDVGQSAATSFFTLPVTTTDKSGALAAGEMKFWKTPLSPYVAYDLSVTTTGTGGMPDIVIFDDLGRFYAYQGSSASPSATHALLYPRGGTYYIGVYADAGAVASYALNLVARSDGFSEGFETGDTSAQPWSLSSLGTGAISPKVVSNTSTAPATGLYSLEFASQNMSSGDWTSATLQKTLASDSMLSFKVKTDIGTDVMTTLKLYDGSTLVESWNGLGSSWSLKHFKIAAGAHTFKWSLEKYSNYVYSGTNCAWIDDIDLRTSYPVTLSAIDEGFESGAFDRYSWFPSGDVAPTIQGVVSHEGTQSVAFATRSLKNEWKSALSLDVNPTQASSISFWMKSDIGTEVSTSFQFLIDGTLRGDWSGLDRPWVQYSFPLTAGLHSLEWRALKNSTGYYPSSTNSVFIDQISLLSDQSTSIELRPQGTLAFSLGMTGQRFVATARGPDGAIKNSVTFTYSVESVDGGLGTMDANAVFTPTKEGSCRVKVLGSDGSQAKSKLITIHPADWMRQPLAYMGGVYGGKMDAGTGSPVKNAAAGVTISWPDTANFSADGFFTLEGRIAVPESVYNYALVRVTKDGTLPTQETSYLVRSSFSTRIWLRFGAGTYTVEVLKFTSISVDLAGEGDFSSWYYSGTPVYSFGVTNTRDEDGTFRYPSDDIQSDDFRIGNIARDLTYGLVDTRDKIKVIHDYVVQTLYYDQSSLVDGYRKKQDAISALLNKTGVCEGYTSLADALLRSAGIPAKAIGGDAFAGGNSVAHAWTNVLVDGTWLFLDCTWDDPFPLPGDNGINYDYYLLTSMTGIGNDHLPTDQRPERVLGSHLPSWRGHPDGWY